MALLESFKKYIEVRQWTHVGGRQFIAYVHRYITLQVYFFTSQEVGEIWPLLILHIIRDIRTTFYCSVIFLPGGIFHLSLIRNGGRTSVRCSDVL